MAVEIMRSAYAAMLITKMFPPEAAIGGHRTAGLCRHLVEHGWSVTVVSSRPSPGAKIDEGLAASVPGEARTIRTRYPDLPLLVARALKSLKSLRGAPKRAAEARTTSSAISESQRRRISMRLGRKIVDWLSWWLHTPDGCTGWLVPCLWTGIKEGLRHPPNVVYSSGPVWTAHLAGAILSCLMDVPFVADFRDPWCGGAFRQFPYSAHRSVSEQLERLVVRRASRITCAWDGIRKHMTRRYPGRREDICTIRNGFRPEVVDSVEPAFMADDRFVFLHAGTFYGPRSPVPLLQALKRLRQYEPDVAGMTLIVLLGAKDYNGQSMDDLVAEHHVQENVRLLSPVSHREALSLLKGADAALLFGQSGVEELASIPAKAYDYIGVGKPVLAIGAGAEVCEVMRLGGCDVWEAPADDPHVIGVTIRRIVQSGTHRLTAAGEGTRGRGLFTQGKMARQMERVLRDAIGDGPTGCRRRCTFGGSRDNALGVCSRPPN